MNKARQAVNLRRQSTSAGATRKIASSQGTLVVVNKGGTSKDATIERDPDVVRLQVIYLSHLVSVTKVDFFDWAIKVISDWVHLNTKIYISGKPTPTR